MTEAILRTFVQTFFVAQLLVLTPLLIIYKGYKKEDIAGGEYLESGLEQSLILLLFLFVKNMKRLLLRGNVLYQKQKRRNIRNLAATLYIALVLWGALSLEKVYVHQLSGNKETSHLLVHLLQTYTILCVSSIIIYAFHIITIFSLKLLKRKKMPLGKALVEAAHWPVIILFGTYLLLYTIKGLIQACADIKWDEGGFSKNLSKYYYNLFLLAFIYAVFRLVSSLQHEFLSGAFTTISPNKTMVGGFANIARIGLGLIFGIVCWNMLSGTKAVGFGAIVGTTGIGLAFVLRPLIESYFAGIVCNLEGIYSIGDWIYFTDKKIEGVIEELKPRMIVLRTFDKRLLYVPNSLFITHGVVNASRMTHRRVLQKIPVGWITDSETLDKILFDIRSFVYNSPDLDKTQALMVHFTGFGTQGLEITIYALTKTKNWHPSLNVQEHILREAKKIITKHAGSPPTQIVNYTALPAPDGFPHK